MRSRTHTAGGGLRGQRVANAALATCLLGGVFLVSMSPASASPERDAGGPYGVLRTVVEAETEEERASNEGALEHQPQGTPVSYRVGGFDEDGDPCLGWGTTWVEDPADVTREAAEQNRQLDRWLQDQDLQQVEFTGVTEGVIDPHFFRRIVQTEDVPDCEGSGGGLDPRAVRETIIHELPLPDPRIAPGWALTGLPSYLEVGAPDTYDETITGDRLPIPVTVSGSAEYRVDWGDGTVTSHASSGGPHPEGDITHVYADSDEGTVVTVTPVWSVTWSAGGMSVPLTLELTPETVELPVREMQAVRTTGSN
jgi:hypothetical protein